MARSLQDVPAERDECARLGPGNRTWTLFVVSVLGLFLELMLIRWIGTEIRIFACLQNTGLVVCFMGLGMGCLSCRVYAALFALCLSVSLVDLARVGALPMAVRSVLAGGLTSLPMLCGELPDDRRGAGRDGRVPVAAPRQVERLEPGLIGARQPRLNPWAKPA